MSFLKKTDCLQSRRQTVTIKIKKGPKEKKKKKKTQNRTKSPQLIRRKKFEKVRKLQQIMFILFGNINLH